MSTNTKVKSWFVFIIEIMCWFNINTYILNVDLLLNVDLQDYYNKTMLIFIIKKEHSEYTEQNWMNK